VEFLEALDYESILATGGIVGAALFGLKMLISTAKASEASYVQQNASLRVELAEEREETARLREENRSVRGEINKLRENPSYEQEK
jgi:cell division protein FtsB